MRTIVLSVDVDVVIEFSGVSILINDFVWLETSFKGKFLLNLRDENVCFYPTHDLSSVMFLLDSFSFCVFLVSKLRCEYCRVKENAGALTNFEVLDLLNSRGASKDTTRVIAPVARSEYKVLCFFIFFLLWIQ